MQNMFGVVGQKVGKLGAGARQRILHRNFFLAIALLAIALLVVFLVVSTLVINGRWLEALSLDIGLAAIVRPALVHDEEGSDAQDHHAHGRQGQPQLHLLGAFLLLFLGGFFRVRSLVGCSAFFSHGGLFLRL